YAGATGALPRSGRLRRPDGQVWYDGWGTELQLVRGAGGIARLVSAGEDRVISPESLNLGFGGRGLSDVYGADVIWDSGSLIQAPSRRLKARPIAPR
ncbi:MAG: hypothetical protein ACXW2P_08705, partial [Thermoanaerobaculia bacterium]